MSGAGIKITLEGANILSLQLQHMGELVDDQGMWEAIGHAMVAQVVGTFADTRSPYGEQWAELSEATKRRRLKRNKRNFRKNGKLSARGLREHAAGYQPLNDSGRLRNSITYQVIAHGVEFGSDVVYAAAHQFGYAERNISARPFLPVEGLPGDWQNDVLDTIRAHAMEAWK